ncbi:MAG: hypothetical protein R2939_05445 [Kofleriaceae bacterium]
MAADGTVSIFDGTGAETFLGQIQVTLFANDAGLTTITSADGLAYRAASGSSGAPNPGTAGQGGRGVLASCVGYCP